MRELILLVMIVVCVLLDGAFGSMKSNPKPADRWLFYSLLATLVVLAIWFLYFLK